MTNNHQNRRDKSSSQQTSTIGLKAYGWDDFGRDLTRMRPGHQTGFKALDQYVTIPRGAITIVAGRPANCKTSFQLNLLVNMLRNPDNKDSRFYFFSYEESLRYIVTKLIMIMAGEVLHDRKNSNAYLLYLKKYYQGKIKKSKASIRKAVEEFRNYTTAKSERLFIFDRPYKAAELANGLGNIDSDRQIGGVFIDYIQKVPLSSSFRQSARYLEIKKISELLLNSAKKKDIPIIVGAQLGRDASKVDKSQSKDINDFMLSSLRESGDLEQDANIVLGLQKESLDNEESSGSEPTNLQVHILKNRGGPPGGKVTLGFDGRVFKINEKVSFF